MNNLNGCGEVAMAACIKGGMSLSLSKPQIIKLVKSVEDFCAEQGLRFTDPRRHVLEIIASANKPLGAYDVLEHLARHIENPKPPTAYRAIEFLVEHGFVHRIESLNAYVVCGTDHRHIGSQFLVCDGCGDVIEAHLCHLPQDLEKQVNAQDFKVNRWNAEIHGLCGGCSKR